jgi:hypothetical protein
MRQPLESGEREIAGDAIGIARVRVLRHTENAFAVCVTAKRSSPEQADAASTLQASNRRASNRHASNRFTANILAASRLAANLSRRA